MFASINEMENEMQLELSHSNRAGQFVNTTWEKFLSKYLSDATKRKKDRIWIELNKTGKSKLTDESGTLYIEVVK